jgi:asparagine synthase (glutamine-hydrolysing)
MPPRNDIEFNFIFGVTWELALGGFVAISVSLDLAAAESLSQRAVQAMTANAGRPPDSTIRNSWSFAAAFARQNGSSSAIASDANTGSWVAVVGTCFHQSACNDPDSLLRQYLSHGADQLSRSLEGFFAVIVGDGGTKEIIVITDVIGSCHLYCRQTGDAIVLSSSSLALASLGQVSLDPVGCQEFLGTGIIYEDRTLYREVKKLPAASIVNFCAGTEVARRLYWDVSSLLPESLSTEAATDALWETSLSATRKISGQFDHVVCDLTGGYDSRAMTAAFLGVNKPPVTVVSGPEDSADVVVSRGLARKLQLEHLHCLCDETISVADLRAALQLTDGEYEIVEYVAIARIHRQLSQKFQISINGSFGEVARGYWWELLVPHTGARRPLDSQRVSARRYGWGSCNNLFQQQFRMNLVDHMASVIDRSVEGLSDFPNTFQMDVAYLRMRMQRWQGRIASSTNRIWPCLSPFMFRSVLETMLQTCFAARQRSLLVRRMLAKHQPALADYPLEHGYPAVPASWNNLPRFWPLVPYYGRKVAEKLRSRIFPHNQPTVAIGPKVQLWKLEEVRDILDPKVMTTASILEPAALTELVTAPQRGDFSRSVEWNRILTLEMALRAFR